MGTTSPHSIPVFLERYCYFQQEGREVMKTCYYFWSILSEWVGSRYFAVIIMELCALILYVYRSLVWCSMPLRLSLSRVTMPIIHHCGLLLSQITSQNTLLIIAFMVIHGLTLMSSMNPGKNVEGGYCCVSPPSPHPNPTPPHST